MRKSPREKEKEREREKKIKGKRGWRTTKKGPTFRWRRSSTVQSATLPQRLGCRPNSGIGRESLSDAPFVSFIFVCTACRSSWQRVPLSAVSPVDSGALLSTPRGNGRLDPSPARLHLVACQCRHHTAMDHRQPPRKTTAGQGRGRSHRIPVDPRHRSIGPGTDFHLFLSTSFHAGRPDHSLLTCRFVSH